MISIPYYYSVFLKPQPFRYASKWQHCSQALRHEQIPEDHVAALLSVWVSIKYQSCTPLAHCLYVVEGLQIYWLVVARSS